MYEHPQYTGIYTPRDFIRKQNEIARALAPQGNSPEEFYQAIATAVAADRGHSNIHEDSLPDILDRMMETRKPIDGQFTDQGTKWKSIRQVIIANQEQITNWLLNPRTESTFALHAHMPTDKPIGKGFIHHPNDNFQSFQSKYCAVVLRKTDNTPLGFSLVTAFPGVTEVTPEQQREFLQLSDKPITPIIHQTKAFKKGTSAKKAYLDYISDPKHEFLAQYVRQMGDKPTDGIYLTDFRNHQKQAGKSLLKYTVSISKADSYIIKNTRQNPQDTWHSAPWAVLDTIPGPQGRMAYPLNTKEQRGKVSHAVELQARKQLPFINDATDIIENVQKYAQQIAERKKQQRQAQKQENQEIRPKPRTTPTVQQSQNTTPNHSPTSPAE